MCPATGRARRRRRRSPRSPRPPVGGRRPWPLSTGLAAAASIFVSVPGELVRDPDDCCRPGPRQRRSVPRRRRSSTLRGSSPRSICHTDASPLFATQTAPGPVATATGWFPTLIGVTAPALWIDTGQSPGRLARDPHGAIPDRDRSAPASTGSASPCPGRAGRSRRIVRSREFATHTAPRPYATPVGPLPTSILSTTCPPFVCGSICQTVPSRLFATQTKPPPTATDVGPFTVPIVCWTVFVFGSILDDRVLVRHRHPADPSP